MAEIGDVTGGDTITSAFTNDVKDRTVMRYASAATRDASIPTPITGDVAWLLNSGILTIYDGTAWRTMGPRLRHQGNVDTDSSGDFTVSTGFTPTFAACFGTQTGFPHTFMVAQMDATQIKFRAYRLDGSHGDIRADASIGVTYAVWD